MSFTAGTPFNGETLGQSKLEVRNNFSSLRATISQGSGSPGPGDKPNHIDVNSAGAGKHIFVQMPVQTAGTANLPTALEGGLITKTAAGASELFFVRDAVATYFQMTGPVFTGQGGLAKGGTTMLFGGIILKWGQTATNGTKLFATECGSAFPNNCFIVLSEGSVTSITTTSFDLSGATPPVTFIAIGN